MQSRLNGNLEDAKYNLDQFWGNLAAVKATANEATWPEILALDSQSHIQAANLTSKIINQMSNDLSAKAAWIRFFSGTLYNNWIETDQGAAVRVMQDQRTRELQIAADLASQANTATAARAQALATGRISQDAVERAMENTQIGKILAGDSGIPLWAWVAGAIGLVVWLSVQRR